VGRPGLWDNWQPPQPPDPEPDVVPMYGCRPFTPATRCRDIHKEPIPRGSRLYCECGAECGFEHWECMRIGPHDEEPPKAKRSYAPAKRKGGK
jgi:hypothetical protein